MAWWRDRDAPGLAGRERRPGLAHTAPSDEMTAMLGVMRARNLNEFRAALGGFAVPGQTMVAVEAGPAGRAARVVAAHLPRRANAPMLPAGLRPGRDLEP